MDADTAKKLKTLFEKRLKMAAKFKSLCLEFDNIVEDEFGMTHNETDCEEIIDSLDYGTTKLTFDEFIKRMEYYKTGTKIPYGVQTDCTTTCDQHKGIGNVHQ